MTTDELPPVLLDPETPDPGPPPWGRRRRLVVACTTARDIRSQAVRPCAGCGDLIAAWWLVCPACREWGR